MRHHLLKPRRSRHLPGLFSIFALLLLAAPAAVAMAQPGGIGIGGSDPMDEARAEAARMRRAQEYLTAGMELHREGKIVQAKTKLKAAIGLVGLNGPGQAAFQALRQIHEEGMRELERVRTLFNDRKFVEALELAEQTKSIYANLFSGLSIPVHLPNISTVAARMVESIEKNPAARAQIQEHEATKRLKRVKTLERLAGKDPTRYYDLYRAYRKIGKRYPDCPTGRDCMAQSDKLRSDTEIWPVILRERTRRKLASKLASIAMMEANGRTEEAAEQWRALQKRFPGKSRADLEAMAKKPPTKD